MNKKEAAAEIVVLAEQRVEIEDWLEACPFSDGQPFYETAGKQIDDMQERMVILAMELEDNDPALRESLESAVQEGEYGDMEIAQFWCYIATWANRILKEMREDSEH